MNKLSIMTAMGIIPLFLASGTLQAQGGDIGQREYQENCAVCHGATGEGDGPLAGIISEQVSADSPGTSRIPISTNTSTVPGKRKATVPVTCRFGAASTTSRHRNGWDSTTGRKMLGHSPAAGSCL